jgi:hypothetical protein
MRRTKKPPSSLLYHGLHVGPAPLAANHLGVYNVPDKETAQIPLPREVAATVSDFLKDCQPDLRRIEGDIPLFTIPGPRIILTPNSGLTLVVEASSVVLLLASRYVPGVAIGVVQDSDASEIVDLFDTFVRECAPGTVEPEYADRRFTSALVVVGPQVKTPTSIVLESQLAAKGLHPHRITRDTPTICFAAITAK